PTAPPNGLVANTQQNSIILKPRMVRANDDSWGATQAHLNEVCSLLDRGTPVAAGFRITAMPDIIDVGNTTVWSNLGPGSHGAHSMAIVGYVPISSAPGGGYFIVRNSAGSYRGDKGYLYISYNYFRANVADIIVFEKYSNFRPTSGLIESLRTNRPRPNFEWANPNMVIAASGRGRQSGN
ncbi:MAG: hypothetical protein FD128_2803, partial [Hyphomonadaceae bacterium]